MNENGGEPGKGGVEFDGPGDGEDGAPAVDPAQVVAEIAGSGTIDFDHLRALDSAADEILASFVSLWPRLHPERRREVLASLHELSADDATLDFHRIHLSALRDEDAATRMLAIRGLWEQDDVRYMDLLLDQVRTDPEASVRATAAEILGQWVIGVEFGMLSEDDADNLCSTLRELTEDVNEDDEVRARALAALGAHSEEWVSEVISETYETGGPRMQRAALEAMGRNANDSWLPVLVHHFDDDDPEIRASAATSAGQLLLDSAVEPLMVLLGEDEEEEVQVAAIRALGEIASDGAERVLMDLQGRGERHVVEAVSQALSEVRLMSVDPAGEEDEE